MLSEWEKDKISTERNHLQGRERLLQAMSTETIFNITQQCHLNIYCPLVQGFQNLPISRISVYVYFFHFLTFISYKHLQLNEIIIYKALFAQGTYSPR